MSANGAVSASPLPAVGTASRVYSTGRVCRDPGCDTVLSRYNPESWCSLHNTNHRSAARVRGRTW